MDKGFKAIVDELNKATITDATNLLIGMLGGARDLSEDSDKAKKFGDSMYRLSVIGMMCVMSRSKLIPLLMEGEGHSDDTELEDDAIITNR